MIVLKKFYQNHKEVGMQFIKQSTNVLLHAGIPLLYTGMYLKDIVVDGMANVKIITTNSF
jgi:DUF2075 family protein